MVRLACLAYLALGAALAPHPSPSPHVSRRLPRCSSSPRLQPAVDADVTRGASVVAVLGADCPRRDDTEKEQSTGR